VRNIERSSKKKKCAIEVITLILYGFALIFIMNYHEPWFDEAQAWLIARDATVFELLRSITHYEGHPPVWCLILMPVAKMGIPFEIGLKAVNFIFATLAMGIFIFKAPFNKFIRCTIPFTYFFFYQYGVISRPYSLMMLGFVLSALMYNYRDEKPFLFITALALVCSSSAFGIIIAAGIAITWTWESFDKLPSFNEIKNFLKCKKFYSLLVLLIYNVILALLIFPFKDTYAVATDKGSIAANLLYMFFIAPADATCSYGYFSSSIQVYLSIVISCLINAVMFTVTGIFKKRSLFITTFTLFGLFSSTAYFGYHHLGIIAMLYMFILWCCFDSDVENVVKLKNNTKIFKQGYLFLSIMIVISIYWSISASINEISLNYDAGRETAQFIKNNDLENLNILVAWITTNDEETGKQKYYYNQTLGVSTLAYFDKNIFYNFNEKNNGKCYDLHTVDNEGIYTNFVIDNEYPDVLVGTDELDYTFGEKINMSDYALIKSIKRYNIWKDKILERKQLIYIRKDLLNVYDLKSCH
jgi:hypothetical protein